MPSDSSPDRPQFFAQESASTCAIACLRMVLSSFGQILPEAELAQRAKTDQFGTDLHHLILAAESLGYTCQAGSFDLDFLRQARFPIVYLDGPTLGRSFLMHAVVVEQMNGQVLLLDPARGILTLSLEAFREAWETAGSFALVLQRSPP